MQMILIEHQSRAVTIRPAASDDEWAVQLLFAALHAFNAELEPRFALGEGWARELAEQLAIDRTTGEGVALLAWEREEPVGLALLAGQTDAPLFRHRRWAELAALYVVPEARRAGVADLLVVNGLAWAREQGYARLRLWVTAANAGARHFYAKAGFRPIQEVWALELGAPATLAGTESTVADDAA